ncbi:hypothetical protein FACS189475_06230 [Betaproteobacteria bacterium]|nr:hypothetical protein FACS189475_06230 [Betaproteobacteria bacterium]
MRFKLMCRDPMEKAVNHGDTAGTAKSKDKNDFRFLLFAVLAVSPWLKRVSFASAFSVLMLILPSPAPAGAPSPARREGKQTPAYALFPLYTTAHQFESHPEHLAKRLYKFYAGYNPTFRIPGD